MVSDLIRTHETPADRPDWIERRRKPRTGTGKREAYRRRSLFAEILDFMFAPLALLWPLSVVVTFVVARALADVPFDAELEQRLRALANYVEITGSYRPPDSFDAPRGLLALEETQQSAFQVRSAAGELLAGNADLPPPRHYDIVEPGTLARRTQPVRSEDWRIAYTWVTTAAPDRADPRGPVLIQVGETLERRNALANEIIRGIIVPQFLLLPIAVFLVWFGLSRGLHPLKAVQERIRNRRPDDFSPIDSHGTPEEIAPLVTAFNDLLLRLEQNIGAQKRFIGDAAHQLKTPLAGLRMQAELALKEGDANELRNSLRHIASSAERSARMVSQLLSLARMENLRDAALFERLDLPGLARSVVGEWVPQALARGIDLGFECDTGPVRLEGLPLLLRELMNNLIDNALRHTPRGGSVTVRVTRAGIAPSELVLEVEDTGSGIPEADQSRIFDRFYQVLGSRSQGSGLGLAIVLEIADQHQAAVTVTSPVCRDAGAAPGTRFQVRFGVPESGRRPAAAAAGEGAKLGAAPARAAGHPLTHPRATG
jgi:two-component system, OmpR family, sensor histidine kinase TctE